MSVSGTVTYYVYSNEGLIGEYAQGGTVQKTYGWKPGSAWGTNPVFMAIGANTYYFHNDHLGTPQKLTDESGKVVWGGSYEAFGKATVDPVSTITNNLRYPGQYFDEETGLHYNWNRYYEPETGRYVSEDPIGFGAGDKNLYRYVRNRPLNGIDPLGLYDTDDFLYDASNFLIGIGDTVSLGLTKKIRQLMDTDQYVDKCSAAYKGGEIAGALLDFYVGGVAFKGLGKLGRVIGNNRGSFSVKPLIKLFKNGELFEHSFETKNGIVDVIAETIIDGDKLHLKDMAIYARDATEPIAAGLKAIMQEKNVLIEAAKSQGFKTLEITAQRVLNSTSANPGKTINMIIDLVVRR